MPKLILNKLSNEGQRVSQDMRDFFVPNTIIEVDAELADSMGAFAEDAIGLDDMVDANLLGEAFDE